MLSLILFHLVGLNLGSLSYYRSMIELIVLVFIYVVILILLQVTWFFIAYPRVLTVVNLLHLIQKSHIKLLLILLIQEYIALLKFIAFIDCS